MQFITKLTYSQDIQFNHWSQPGSPEVTCTLTNINCTCCLPRPSRDYQEVICLQIQQCKNTSIYVSTLKQHSGR